MVIVDFLVILALLAAMAVFLRGQRQWERTTSDTQLDRAHGRDFRSRVWLILAALFATGFYVGFRLYQIT